MRLVCAHCYPRAPSRSINNPHVPSDVPDLYLYLYLTCTRVRQVGSEDEAVAHLEQCAALQVRTTPPSLTLHPVDSGEGVVG